MDPLLMMGAAGIPAVAAFGIALGALTRPGNALVKPVMFETDEIADARRHLAIVRDEDEVGRPSHERLLWTAIMGENEFQPALRAIAGKTSVYARLRLAAQLVAESDHRFDPNAVRVVINDRTVGYLSQADAINYRALGKQAATCGAKVCGGGPRHPSYGVWLDL
jgi:hypothetical protein